MANSAIVGILRALLTLDSAQFESGMRRAADSAKVFSRDTKQIGLQASQIGAQLTRTLTLPILGFGGAVAKAAIDFESSFAGVRKTVNASEAEFARLSQQMRDLSKEIPVNVNELNKLGEAAGALGIPKEEIVGFTKVMALLGVTTNVTSEQAAESIAKIQTVFQAAGKETDRFAATLVDLGNKGASTEAQILELAQRLGSAGRAIGLSQADVLGFASAIANVGIEAEAGGSAISRVFADISMAVSLGGDDVAAFAKIAGKSAADFSKAFKDDAAGAVTAFIEGLGKAHAAGGDLNLILKDLGFEEIRQARALRDLALSGTNLAGALRIANAAWTQNTALTEEARKRFETTRSQLTLLWNRIKDVAVTLGNALLPMIKSIVAALDTFVPMLERAATAFANLPMPIQAVAVSLGLMAAAAGPLLFVFGQLMLSASAVAGAFTKKGIATRALTGLLGGAGGLTTAVRAAGTAFAGSAVAVGLFTAALAGIVVPFALIKIAEVIEHLHGLIKDSAQWRLNALEENAAHMRVLAEASKVAGREITNFTEATSILKGRIATLQEAQRLGGKEFQGLTIVTDLYGTSQKNAATAAGALGTATESMRAKLAAANAVINGLTAAQRAEIKAGIDLNQNNEEIAKSFAKLFPNVKMTEEIVGIFKDQLSAAATNTKKLAKEQEEAAEKTKKWHESYSGLAETFGRWVQVVDGSAAGRKDLMDFFTAMPPAIKAAAASFDADLLPAMNRAFGTMGMNALPGVVLSQGASEKVKAELDEVAAHWQRFRDTVTNLFAPIRAGIGDAFGALIFGTGDNSAADRAEEDYKRIKAGGKASAEEITRAYRAMKDAQDEFGGRFKAFWQGLVNSLKQTLNNFLQYFIQGFLNGMIRALAGSSLGQKVGGWLSSALGFGGGGIPGVAGLFGMGGGAALASTSAVPTTAALLGAAPAGAGAAAGGAGIGAAIGALATNPITIAAAGVLALWASGAMSGGAGAKKIQAAWLRGDTMLEGRPVPDSIGRMTKEMFLLAHAKYGGKPVGSFKFGGFVPPNVTMPAILHGGRYGEDIVPRNNPEGQFNRGTRIEIHNHISAIDARGIREFVESKQYLDSMSRVFEDNKGFVSSRVGRALKP